MKELNDYLIIDDDPTNNIICEFTIKRFDKNATIHLFTRPEDGLRFIRNEDYKPAVGATIMFLDVNMPTMSGFEFLEEFRELRKEIIEKYRIYILTSSVEDYSSRATEYPMVRGFLSKPLNLTYLENIHSQLQSS